MAGGPGPARAALAFERALAEEPYRFTFYTAVRRLECLYRDRPRVGTSQRPAEDPLRLGQEPSSIFAPSDLSGLDAGREGRPARLSVLFFGLFGPNGPLPLHLTEYARDRWRNYGDPAFARFADVFHHRMLSLLYRAWATAQPAVNFDRPGDDRFATYVGALIGLGPEALRDRDAAPDLVKLHHAGHLGCGARHADGLRGLLSDFLRLPVAIDEFVPEWIELPEHGRWRLGASPETGTLGLTTTAGARVLDGQQKFRVVVGPLSRGDYERLLPGSKSLARLAALVRLYAGDELSFCLRLVLRRDEVPPLQLGGDTRLGLTTWVSSRTPERDPDDLVLTPPGVRTALV